MGMIVKDKSVKPILKKVHDADKVAVTSMKFMNTIGWLIRALLQNSKYRKDPVKIRQVTYTI